MKGENMLKNINKCVFCILILGMIYPRLSLGEEKWKQLDKKTRAKIHYVLTINLSDGIEKTLSEPIKIVREKLLTSIEQENGIKIERSSMVRTDKCLRDLLTSIPHLAKISTGNKIIRAKIELNAATSTKSIWTRWRARKLERPELKMTLFYDSKAIEPTEIICSGNKYQ